MKSCPTCNRTFEETFTFCLADGSLLNAPFDPQATLAIPAPRQTAPPPTEVRQPQAEIKEEVPPTVAARQPTKRDQDVLPTLASPVTEFETVDAPQRMRDQLTRPARKSHRLPLMIGAVATLLVIGAAVFILGNRTDSARQNPLNDNAATANAAASASANSTNSNSANAAAASDKETSSSNQSTIKTKTANGETSPSPSRPSAKEAPRVSSPSVSSGRKDNSIVDKPVRPDVNASSNPCANQSYPVCEPGEKLVCGVITGRWECRRSR